MANQNLLQNLYLFNRLSVADLDKINKLVNIEVIAPGDEIFVQGENAHSLYVIKYGSIRIRQKTKNGDLIEIATLGTGSHFGEMSFLDGEKRSATASAIEKTDLVVISYEQLWSLLNQDIALAAHVYRELAQFLCGRLRVTTNDLSFAREKNLSHF